MQGEPCNVSETIDETSDMEEYSLYRVISDNPVDPPIMIDVKIDGMPVEMELDTGACKTIISEETFRNLRRKHQKKSAAFGNC